MRYYVEHESNLSRQRGREDSVGVCAEPERAELQVLHTSFAQEGRDGRVWTLAPAQRHQVRGLCCAGGQEFMMSKL